VASYHCLTFLTDYGLEDGFVAACHGVCLQIVPDVRIIDITHRVNPGDIQRGAVVLAQAVPFGTAFGEVAAGELIGYTDSAGFVAIAVNGGSAAQRLGLRPGTRMTLTVSK
jgi:S-adenosylmethionine hydrolase